MDEKQVLKMDDTFIRDQSAERDISDVPRFMLYSERKDLGFFFGTKRCEKNKLDDSREIVIAEPAQGHVDVVGNAGNCQKALASATHRPVALETTASYKTCFVGKPQYRDGKEYDGHILVVGGAGSGKSSCIAMPTLETWGGTIFAIDIKGELTAHWEKIENKNRPAKIFNLTNERGLFSTYDPFYFLHQNDDNLVQNVREIAHSIIPLPPDTKEPFWIQSARHVLTAALLYGYKEDKSVSGGDKMNKSGD